ncbi:MAG: tRNA (N6-isopentenyl adenosine(37)-C2)-methylthiotransferase MiaB [Syntrophobacterales bacterium]|nr:tRNA (N6-isopentenyl adenosine(37)-C2)-methylthiotransferase MiaB [Syntrophobacterales bacterium]
MMRDHLLLTSCQKRRIFVHTFGCQMNEYDSLRLVRTLLLRGYVTTTKPSEADVIFINTCSVRAKAEQKLYSLLGRLKRLKDQRPNVVLIVGGCVAQQLKGAIVERFPFVDIVVGTRGISELPDRIERVFELRSREVFFPDEETSLGLNHLDVASTNWSAEVVEFVTIMQGCDNFCSYCIVPHVRGRERSRPSHEIIEEIRMLSAKGAKEIVLLGQNVNSYGKNLSPPVRFSELIERIASETDIIRLRFTTSHPKDLTEDLMACFRDISILCPHLHLPFQAGSDRILSMMNRGYTQLDYIKKVERIRSYRPDIALTADVMVGFPTEEEKDFRETLKLIEIVEFDGLFSFKYSDRPFTVASSMGPKVDERTKTRRLAELQKLQKDITFRKNRAEEGTIRTVLVEGESRLGSGQLTGRTPHNRIVNFEGPKELIGKEVAVRITEGYAHSLKGELMMENKL